MRTRGSSDSLADPEISLPEYSNVDFPTLQQRILSSPATGSIRRWPIWVQLTWMLSLSPEFC